MFGLVSGLYKTLKVETKLSILVVGCDGAGKTALLERCKVTHFSKKKTNRKKDSKNHNSYSVGLKNNAMNNGRQAYFCPSPASYSPYYTVADDDSITDAVPRGTTSHLVILESAKGSKVQNNKTKDKPKANKETSGTDQRNDVDIREGAKMLPLHLITPTVGMNLAKKIDAFGCKCNFWDLSGQERMRLLWERYYADADAVVFVVDVTASEIKMKEACKAFQEMRSDKQLDGVPILIFANKMDVFDEQNYVSKVNDLIEMLDIFSSDQQSQYRDNGIIDLEDVNLISLFSGSAKTGEGVHDAFEWLITTATEQMMKLPR